MKITRILLILIMGFSVVFALNVPKASKYDAKITFATYNANDFQIVSDAINNKKGGNLCSILPNLNNIFKD